MKKSKNRSEVSLSTVKSEIQYKEEIYVPPLDTLSIKVLDLQIPDEESKPYALKITFFDQLLLSSVIISRGFEAKNKSEGTIAKGLMNYDPSDYEKMCLFADNPLIAKIHPHKSVETDLTTSISSTGQSPTIPNRPNNLFIPEIDASCCNIDIMKIFTDKNEIVIEKRMEPITPLPVTQAKSWDNFPVISLKIKAIRNKENEEYHRKFRAANFFKLTLVGCYNLIIPHNDKSVYTAATKLPLSNEKHNSILTYNNDRYISKRLDCMSFYPQWESLRSQDQQFTKGDEKFQSNLTEFYNENMIDLNHYIYSMPKHCITWASFHRTILLKDTERWLAEHIRRYKWPLEVHINSEDYSYSFMGFIDLFKLLYPGERTTKIVVPLEWIDGDKMMEKCGCELLLKPNESIPSITIQKTNRDPTDQNVNIVETSSPQSTGSDENCAFVILEVTLGRPFKNQIIPRHIKHSEIKEMLVVMESLAKKRECSGRGQLDNDWRSVVQIAANSLRRVPYCGTIDRQLCVSRTRVELVTSFSQEAAIYVNNNFVVSDFLLSDVSYEEMVTIAHACMMRIAHETLTDTDNTQQTNATLRAARHARQLQDLPHAVDLYIQLIVEKSRDAAIWRELATSLRDIDRDWAKVCINKSMFLNPRNPLSILSKGCMVFEDDPDAAEPFFTALLALYPFWVTFWVAANAYYLHRELYHVADAIMAQVKMTRAEGLSEEFRYPRAWERELGDWWDNTPLLPGTSLYYDAADLLLRIRAISLAEVCIARALSETGVSPVYYHMVALCCRLKGHIEDALCHVKQGIQQFGEISYLRSLEGECHHKKREFTSAMASFDSCGSPYVILLSLPRRDHQRVHSVLSDLTRRHPCAYAWIAFAEYWVMHRSAIREGDGEGADQKLSATSNAVNCALKALKYDRRAGRAWALLADLLSPSARRQYCKEMAVLCNYNKRIEERGDQDSSHFHLGKVLGECRCNMCENISV